MSDDWITITGAREHNLKGVDVQIPRNRLTVVTGLSGSGKSSLAFDTLFAEGQRRYVESLSAYARQFLDQLQKPDVEHIDGLAPAIAIEQRTAGSNPRSIVATTTEIHDYLRLLYGNIGKAHCPSCRKPVRRQSAEEIVDQLVGLPTGSRVMLLAPFVRGKKGRHEEVIENVRRLGFVRARIDGTIYDVEEAPALKLRSLHTIEAVVDRLVLKDDIRGRLTDSVELCLLHGQAIVIALVQDDEGEWQETLYSERNACLDCGISFEDLVPRHFSFNSHYGACPKCAGLGTLLTFEESLVVPDPSLAISAGAIPLWRRGGRRVVLYYKKLMLAVAEHYGYSVDTPFNELPPATQKIILHGTGEEPIEMRYRMGGKVRKSVKPFEGVIPNLHRRYETTESDFMRQKLRESMTQQVCDRCEGGRLKPESLACTVGERSILDVMRMSINDAHLFFEGLVLTKQQEQIAREVLREIRRRLNFLVEVGLDYLTLERESGTLSGGEAQRLRLATQIGSGLTGVLYVLDEPTIGLHVRDNARLIQMLKELRDRGNTVVVVEHDEEMIREADYLIDLGPGAGKHGGEVVFEGTPEELLESSDTLTAQYLRGERGVAVPTERVKPSAQRLKLTGACENNLKNVTVEIPLGLFACVTGVSGSGKSTLVDDILRRELMRQMHHAKQRAGKHGRLTGVGHIDKMIVIDQSAIGRTPRSNPATYTGAFTTIREIFAKTPAAKVRGYGPGRFSFNVKGGRCESCKGDGMLKLEMHFLPDVYVECELCGGKRYNRETLEVYYKGKNIAEVLHMTISEATEFFEPIPRIARKLRTLEEVGLGYLQLGQPATTLSGGEAQRVKLATELSKQSTGQTLYMLDEPTTGLHFADTHKLLQVLLRLRDAGNSILVIEHNMDVIKTADYIIDLGPNGGVDGGTIVATGTPEAVAKVGASHTGQFLAGLLNA